MYVLSDSMGGRGGGLNPVEAQALSGPTIYISRDEEMEMPKEGTAMIKYRLRRKSESEEGDRESYSYEIEVLEIGCFGKHEGKRKSKYDEAGEAIDKLAKGKMEMEEEDDD